jgi:hypothetical protein
LAQRRQIYSLPVGIEGFDVVRKTFAHHIGDDAGSEPQLEAVRYRSVLLGEPARYVRI